MGELIQLDTHTTGCAVTAAGTIDCWGTLQEPTSPGPFLQVGLSNGYGCAIERTNGAIACWTRSTDRPVLHPPTGNFTQLSVMLDTGCALRSDATLACWGDATDFPLVMNPPTGRFRAVAAAAGFACALQEADGTIACWGGDGDPINSMYLTPPAGSFIQIASGVLHWCALRTDGTVACWGRREAFQPGPATSDRFVDLDGGNTHTCAIRTDGVVRCWGEQASMASMMVREGFIAKHR